MRLAALVVPGLGYYFHSPPVVSPPIFSFSRGATRLPCEARNRARLPCAALYRARAAQRAWRLAVQRARSLCCPVRPCAARNRTARGTRRVAQGTRARGTARSCTPMTQPAPCAGSPTNGIHSAGTPRGAPPGRLLLCCHRRLQNAHRSPSAGLNCLVMPRPPAPGSHSGSPRPASTSGWRASPVRPRIAPPAPPARALHLELCDSRSSLQQLTPTARRCSSPASPPRLAAPACSPRPPY